MVGTIAKKNSDFVKKSWRPLSGPKSRIAMKTTRLKTFFFISDNQFNISNQNQYDKTSPTFASQHLPVLLVIIDFKIRVLASKTGILGMIFRFLFRALFSWEIRGSRIIASFSSLELTSNETCWIGIIFLYFVFILILLLSMWTWVVNPWHGTHQFLSKNSLCITTGQLFDVLMLVVLVSCYF